jgi:hypothetical protein
LRTNWAKAAEVVPVKSLSPEYETVIAWFPRGSVPAENAATPFDSVPVPSCVAGAVAPSMKVTVPVGVPVAGATADTVAVNVTD